MRKRNVILPVFLLSCILLLFCENRTITYYSNSQGYTVYTGDSGTQYIFLNFSGVNISDGEYNSINAALSTDGSIIVFQSEISSTNYDIFSMNIDGSEQKNLTDNPDNDMKPVISPDGSKIAFYRNADVYLMDIDGNYKQKISQSEVDTDYPIRFTHDGQHVVVTSIDDGRKNISLIDIEGNSQVILTQTIGGYDANMAPNSDIIIFVSGESNNRNIYTMSYTGGGLNKLTIVSGNYRNPCYSPDESTIVFSNCFQSLNYYNLFTMSVDGPPIKRLTDAYTYDTNPVFTPDGEWIAFNRWFSNDSDIIFVTLDRTYEVNYTNTISQDELSPVFSMSQPYMFFQSNRGGNNNIWATSLNQLSQIY